MKPIDAVERQLLLDGIYLRYGYDFRQYAEASLDRRLGAILDKLQVSSLLDVLRAVLESSERFHEILPLMTINTTEFFRDPSFYRALRERVFSVLKTYPRIQIWSAGCSTGEEVISLAIALHEEGLLKRTIIHATDVNPHVIKVAKAGIYELSHMTSFNKNYVAAGGKQSPSEYYTAEYGLARFDPTLLENVVFADHNLATDAPFIAAHLITCRNVLIYFDRSLQDRCFHLFAQSLVFRGFLGIGSKESMRFSTASAYFDSVDAEQNVYALSARPVTPLKPMGRGKE